MFVKIQEAVGLLVSNLGLFAGIVLTIRLPGNGVANYLDVYVFDPRGTGALQVNAGIELIFGPLYIGAVVYAASRLLQDQAVTYGEAMGVGARNWFILWLAWLGAGLFIGLGLSTGFVLFIGIFFIILTGVQYGLIDPVVIGSGLGAKLSMTLGLSTGIIFSIFLAVRYTLIDSVVILDGPGPPVAWKRSGILTKGRRWSILGVGVMLLMGSGLLMVLMSSLAEGLAAVGWIGLLGEVVVNTISDCLQDVLLSAVAIVMLLFYLEAQQNRRDK